MGIWAIQHTALRARWCRCDTPRGRLGPAYGFRGDLSVDLGSDIDRQPSWGLCLQRGVGCIYKAGVCWYAERRRREDERWEGLLTGSPHSTVALAELSQWQPPGVISSNVGCQQHVNNSRLEPMFVVAFLFWAFGHRVEALVWHSDVDLGRSEGLWQYSVFQHPDQSANSSRLQIWLLRHSFLNVLAFEHIYNARAPTYLATT